MSSEEKPAESNGVTPSVTNPLPLLVRRLVVPILFCRHDSIYRTLEGTDVYDEDRDARTWPGGCPVVAHPPCRTWGCLKAFARAPPHEHALAPWAVEQVQRWGGVLEHPKGSSLWKELGLPKPGDPPDEHGGWTLEVDQFHWGHKARKRTWLYIVGTTTVPPLPHRSGAPTHCVGRPGGPRKVGQKPCCQHWEREATPKAFAKWLLALAKSAGRAD